MSWSWVVPGVVMGLVVGGVVEAAIIFAECTDPGYDSDTCQLVAYAFAIIGAGTGAVVSVVLFGFVKATKLWVVFVMFMGITLGVSIGGITGMVFTEDMAFVNPRPSSVAPYVGLVSGGILGAVTGAFGYLYRRRILGLMQADEDWRR